MFNIRMGIPEMEVLWNKLQTGHRNGKNTMDIYAECTAEKKREEFATLNGKIMIK